MSFVLGRNEEFDRVMRSISSVRPLADPLPAKPTTSQMLTALHSIWTHVELQDRISNWVVAHPGCWRMDAVEALYQQHFTNHEKEKT